MHPSKEQDSYFSQDLTVTNRCLFSKVYSIESAVTKQMKR
jgi:hypothetical protein